MVALKHKYFCLMLEVLMLEIAFKHINLTAIFLGANCLDKYIYEYIIHVDRFAIKFDPLKYSILYDAIVS